MKKTTTMGILLLLLVGIAAAGAYAFGSKFQGNDAMKEALEAGDYDSYLAAVQERQRQNTMTEDQFNERKAQFQAMEDHRATVQSAIEAGDYDAWKAAMDSRPRPKDIIEIVTAENFAKFVEMHNARQAGDFDTANAIAEELGIEGMGFGQGNGMQKGTGNSMRGMGMNVNCPNIE